MDSKLAQAQAAAKELKQFIAELKEKRIQALGVKERLLKEKNLLLSQPLNKDDLKQFIATYVDARAEAFPKLAKLGDTFSRMANPSRGASAYVRGKALNLRDVNSFPGKTLEEVKSFFGDNLEFFPGHLITGSDIAACYFFGDVIKAKMFEAFDGLFSGYALPAERQDVGTSIEERRARISDIDHEIEGLEEQVAAIDQQLSGLGVIEPESRKPLAGVPFMRGGARG
ncbi:TPA: hypothetical protein SMS80_005561 [Pseudomonas aeruginosa]|nr:hypothetical protein [Pseudomonas aeruginosa]